MSKITHNTIPDFGNPSKTEEQKKEDTMMAWVGMTSVDDLEPADRQNFKDAIKGKSNSAQDFFRQNLDYGERESVIKDKLKKIESWLSDNNLEEAKLIQAILK